VYGAAEAVALGYNALLFEGPGQGSMLHLRGIGFRPDWEAVITPVVDYLVGRPDVDPGRIALVGWSQGGALAARAAAFEHRLAALVLDPGVSDFMAVFHLPEELVRLARTHPAEAGWTGSCNPVKATAKTSIKHSAKGGVQRAGGARQTGLIQIQLRYAEFCAFS
jgi:pimeloyl-ACP methyl ester carboxylesterase